MKKVSITATVLMGALLFGAGVATAAPAAPAGPTDFAVPATPPRPEPCDGPVRCDLTSPTLEPPTLEPPTDIVSPTLDPTDPTDPIDPAEPVDPAEPAVPANPAERVTTTRQPPVEQPGDAPSGVPTPNRIDTGAGPADPIGTVNWWVVTGLALALLALVAAGTVRWIQRTERRPS
jgi:hypothetical protein